MAQYKLIQIQGSSITETAMPQSAVVAKSRTIYRIKDELGAQPEKMVLWRRGSDLVVEVKGQKVLTMSGFYAAGVDAAQAPQYLLDTGVPGNPWIVTGREPQEKISASEDLVWKLDDDVVNTTLSPDQLERLWANAQLLEEDKAGAHRYSVDESARQEIQDLLNRWSSLIDRQTYAAVTANGIAQKNGPAAGATDTTYTTDKTNPALATEIGDLIITGSVAAGPVHSGVTLYAYDTTGLLLGSSTIGADGRYTITVPLKGDYRGTVLLKVMDSNAAASNYLDEVTASNKSLDTTLRALGVAQEGQTLFTVMGLDAHLIINITPLTELAVRQAGVVGDVAVAAAVALQANANVATAFGLAGVALTGNVVTTNSAAFNARNGLSDAEKYGLALTKLSGLDSLNAGNMTVTLDLLAANLNGNALNTTGATLVDQGRVKALDSLKTVGTTFNSGANDLDNNTVLNRQLLGEIVVTEQRLNPQGQLVVSGTALPGSRLTITLPDGTTQQTDVDASGAFTLTSITQQVTSFYTLQVSGADALSASVVNRAPAAIFADMAAASDTGTSNTDNITRDTTPTISGIGIAGDTITVTMPGTGEVLTTTVADDGTWSVTPTRPLADGTANASVIATNTIGSSPATFVPITIDTTPPVVPTVAALTSNTLTPTLSGTAVVASGETFTVTVHGATYAVTPNAQGLWSLDLASATPISGTLGTFEDGSNYSVQARITDSGGNTSIDSSAGELTINTSAPSVTLPEAPKGVNGTEAANNTGTPLLIRLPQNAQDGDTVTSVVTKPDGTTLTLTTVLSQADIDAGSIEQIILTADLTVDGVWNTITTITPNGGTAGPAAPGSFTLDTVVPTAPAADVAALSDTGTSSTDNLTTDTTPTISGGGATPGDIITVTMPGTGEVLTTVVAANGTWSVTPTQALAEGPGNVTVTATDPVGNTSATTTVALVIDATAPAAPVADVAAASDTGTSSTDNITRDNTPEISGTGTAGDTITVTLPTGEVLTAVVAGNGSWSVTPTQALPEGTTNVSVTATDPAGNVSAPATVPVTIDTTPPAPPAADLAASSDSGASNTDNITTDTTPTITGSGTPGHTIKLYAPNGFTVLGATTVASDGTWSITPATAQPEGLNTFKVTATDLAGNTSAPADVPVTIDNTANVPTVVPTLGNTLTPVITGGANLAPGESLTVTVGGATYAVVPDAQGTWILNLATATPVTGTGPLTLANGTHSVTAVITDAAGNVGTDISTNELVIDTGRIAVSLPEAPLGVNAAEAASAGGTPVVSQLPVGAVAGDVVTTTVTKPGGGTLTLTTTLSGADILAGRISQLIPSSELSNANNGAWTTSTTLDHNGVPGTATPGGFTLDTVAPAAPAADVATLSDTGSSNSDNNTSDNTPTISGTGATPGDTITVTLPTGEVLKVVVPAGGNWSVTPTQSLPDGAANVLVTATDPAGNTSAPTTVALVIDTAAPAAPGVAIPEAAGGVSAAEAANGVQLSVTLPADARVGDVVTTVVTAPNGTTSALTYTVLAADVSTANGGTAIGSGPFTVTQTVPLLTLQPAGANTAYLDGDWTTRSTLTDPAGNVSPAMADGFTLSATPPTISIATVAGDNMVNAAEASGALPVAGTTTAEPGQTVTVQLVDGATVLGTYTAVVQANGSYSLNIPAADLPANGSYALKADVSNAAGTPATQASRALTVDTTAPVITITSIAGDAIDPIHLTGEFNAAERGALTSRAVTTRPVISGTTTAEVGQTVTLTLDGQTYTTTVQNGGVWTYTLSNADALGLNHGSTYAITATVSDVAGNTGTDTDNGLVVNTAAPDIPTVVEQYTALHTPTITGRAMKDAGGNTYINLANGDVLTVTVNSATYTLTVGGTSSPAGLTYTNGTWSLLPASIPNGHYEVAVSVTAGGITKTDISNTELHINDVPPVITLNPISGGTLNDAESTQPLPITGTTDAPVGATVTLTLDGQTYTAVVQAGGIFSVTVPGSAVAAIADGTQTVSASVVNAYGLTGNGTQSFMVDTTAPGAATVAIPEGTLVNAAEALSAGGTALNITLPAGSQVGDVVKSVVTAPDGSVLVLSTTLTAAQITAGSISQLIPTSALTADGAWTTSTTITDTAGNTGPTSAGGFTLDTTAPAAPSGILNNASDSGLAGDSTTSDTTPTLSGAGEPGDTITVKDAAGNVIATATVQADGTWSATPTAALPEGINALKVTATDPAGNTSAPADLPVTIDTMANVPTVVPTLGNTLTPVLTGGANLAPGESLTVTVGGATYAVTPNDQGVWTLNLATATPTSGTLTLATANTYNVTAVITDAAGNVGTDVSTGELSIDVGRIAVSLPEASNGVNAAEATSAGGTPVVSSLPSGAVAGDVVTTIVTKPGGGTLTLTTTLSATDIVAGTISQLIPSSELTNANNGAWTTSTKLNNGTATPGSFTLDTVVPAAPAADVAAASDTGSSSTDNNTSDNTPVISGTGATPGDTITVTLPTGEVLEVVVPANGNWSVTPTQALPDGAANVLVTATDPMGNTSPATTVALVIDTTAPAAPVADVATLSDTGTSSTDNLTRDNTPTLSGTGTAGHAITVTLPTGEVLNTVVAGDGTWSVTPTQALPEGSANVSVTATDPAGNTSAPANVALVIDTQAPAAPAADILATSDSGRSDIDNITRDDTPTIGGGGATPGDTITVTMPGTGEVLTAVVAADGSWYVTPTQALANGTAQVSVTATDPAGNVSPATLVPVTIDTTAPTAPVADVAAESDNGASNTDNLTNDTTPTLRGTGSAGDTITVTLPTGEVLTTVVASDGSWSVTPTQALPSGVASVSVTATDAAGNTSPASTVDLTIDTSAPAAPTVNTSLTSDTTPVLRGTASVQPGETLTVTVNGATYTVVPDAQGQWRVDTQTAVPTSGTLAPFANGQTYNVTATTTDAAGNSTSDVSTGELSIDTSLPATPADPDLTAATDTGASDTDNLTSNNTPGFAVTAPPAGGTHILYVDGVAVAATYANGVLTPNSALPDGPHTITYAVQVGSFVSETSGPLAIVIDTAAPATPPAPDLTSATDSGGNTSDDVTGNNRPDFAVTAPPTGGSVVLLVDGVAVAATYDPNTGTITPNSPLADGVRAISYQLVDAAGNTSSASAALSVTVDTAAPATPAAPDMTAATDSGVNTDNLTSDTTPSFTVTAPPAGGNVVLYVDGLAVPATYANGEVTPLDPLPAGAHTITYALVDTAGNASAASPSLAITIDATATAAPTVAIAEAAGGVSAAEAADGVALSITLPAGAAVGDVVTTVVAGPGGATITLTTTLNAGHITAGSISETVPYSTLHPSTSYLDGAWTTSTTLTDAAGNTSPADTDGFSLAANTPTVTIGNVAGDDIINAAEKSGAVAVGGSVTFVEPGQTVTVKMMNGAAVLATYTAIVQANGTYSLNIPAADLLSVNDGSYTLTADATNLVGTAAAQVTRALVLDATAPAISVTSVSGDAVTGSQNGTFGVSERGLPSATVTTRPVISGTTDAADNAVVTLTLNGQTYTTTAQSGAWTYTLSNADAVALNHGSTYAITASVTDAAGNTGRDSDNGMVVDIATPDTPTVVELYTASHMPTLTGKAQKDAGGNNYISLATGDVLTVAVNNVTYSLTIGGTSSPTGLTYDTGTKLWSLAVTNAIVNGNYEVAVSVTTGGGSPVTKTDVSATELHINDVAPLITLNTISGGTINLAEENLALPISGSTNAPVGSTVTVNIGGTDYTATVVAGGGITGQANSFVVTVPGTDVAALADGTRTATASVINRYGVTGTDTETVLVDTTPPTAPPADVATASDSGSNTGDNITNDTTPTISGTGTNGDTITVVMPGTGEVLTATVTGGVWSVTPTQTLTNGTADVRVTATDPAGNTSPVTLVPVTIDTTPPAAPVVTPLVTGDSRPIITGTATMANGDTLQVTVNGATYNVTVTNGAWTLDTSSATPVSGALGTFTAGQTYSVTASVTDLAGNTSSDTSSGEISVVTSLLAGRLDASSDSGISGDARTNDTTPTISGTGKPGDTIRLFAANGTTVLGTTVVLADGSWVITPTTALAQGLQNLSITATSPSGSVTGPATVPVTIDTASTITITSVAGDAVAASGNGTFSIGERGINGNDYTLSTTVATPPVVSGTTDADVGSTVTLMLNSRTYTTTVQTGGTWSYTLSDADAKLLNHGNTYAITASVTDAAANIGTDTNNGVVVNIAPPDVPTVNNQQNITTLVPIITGTANKINNSNATIALDSGDVLTVALKNSAGATLATYTLTVGSGTVTTGTDSGTSPNIIRNTELSYSKTTGIWTLGGVDGIPAGVFTSAGVYNVDVTTTVPNGGSTLSRTDVSSSEITILPTPPIIDSTAWSLANTTSDLTGVQEAYFDVNSPTFVSGISRTVDNRLWYSEASTPTNTAGTVVRVQLPYGTGSVPAVAGDVIQLNWGTDTTTQVTLSGTNITNHYVDVTVPYSVISAQSFGSIAISAKLLVTGTTLEASTATLNATYFFDLPLANTGGVAGDNFGYQINGRPSDNIGAKSLGNAPGTVMVGDVNGDGYDDMVIGAGQTTYSASAAAFVVFGSSAPQNVDLSAIALGNSTQGFMIAGLTATGSISLNIDHGDFNGDGLDDISLSGATPGNYIIYGRSNSTATVQVSTLTTTANSNGLKVNSGFGLNNLGDLNGDGVQDWGSAFGVSMYSQFREFQAQYGTADATSLTIQDGVGSNFRLYNGGGTGIGYNDYATGADVNGDGYTDLVLRGTNSQDGTTTYAYVYFGSASGLSTAAGQSYTISGLGGWQGEMIGTGDINGDGKADMVMSTKGSTVYVNFGKSTSANYSLTEFASGTSSNGFMVQGVTTGTADVFLQARVVGDFNGDGLDDFVFRQENMTINGANTGGGYLIYGKTSSSTVFISDLKVSEGFRIDGVLSGDKALTAVSGGGDVNGDGFADLIVSSPNAISTSNNGVGQASGTTAGGVDYIIYGGPSILNPMVFQASRGDLIGTGVDEALSGNSGNNQIVGGQGNDTLVGAGGSDILAGGAGNDVFVLNADNVRTLAVRIGVDTQNIARVDGGSGMDTLRFAEPLVLSLQSARTRLENLERFDLNATGGTLQIETGLDVNATVGDYNRFSTANGWTVTGTVTGFDGSTNYYQVVVDGSSADTVRLGAGFVKETGSLTYAGSATTAGAYDVYTSSSTRSQVLVKQGVQVVPVLLPAAAITLPEADLISSFGFLSLAEAQDTGSVNNTTSVAGTPVLVSLAGLGAAAGDQVRVNWENQPAVLYTLTADDLSAGLARVSVPASALLAATVAGTKETVGITAQVFNAVGVPLTTVGVSSAAVDFVTAPTTPPVNAPIIASVGSATTSAMAGLTEVVNTNVIYRSAALDGVQVNVVLKTAAAAGDWLKFTWGSQEYTYKFTAAVAINTPTAITIPYAVVDAQGMGTFNVSVQQFKADGVSGTAISAASTVTGVRYAFDMQANEGATDATRGFTLVGEAASHNAGYAVSNAGDVNGDGFDDFIVGAPGAQSNVGRSYVVFGGSKAINTLQLSELSVVGNTRGFVINGAAASEMSGFTVTGGGDINGDGLADLVVASGANYAISAGWYPMEYASGGTTSATYVVFGKANTTAVNLTALTAATNLTNATSSLGFKINTTGVGTPAGWSVSNAGDVNGDGLDDMLVANPNYGARDGRAYLIYGKASGAAVEVSSLPAIGASNNVGFMVTADQSGANPGLTTMASGDVNGDGYSDLVLGAWYQGPGSGVGPGGAYVVYGNLTNTSLDISTLTAGSNTRGFQIIGEGNAGIDIAGVGDVNGDGLADVLLQGNQGLVGAGNTTLKGAAWVAFGKTDNNPINVSSIEAGVGGFAIGLGLDTTNYGAYAVSSAGDFNGDGLTDVIVTHANAPYVNNGVTNASAGAAYIVFGKTGTGTVQVTSLDGSEGFRIVNPFVNERMGGAVAGGGDINGDGFDDVIIGNHLGDTTLTDNGKVYVIYGGVSNTQSTVFQVSNGDRIGTAAADTLTGTTGANHLVGGLGNDTLIGGGGADVLYGGAGQDVMQVNADNLAQLALTGSNQSVMRIDGGGGIDTLKFDGSGLMLDLANVKGIAMQNMEKVDLTGSGNNTLKLTASDLLENFTSADVWNAANSSTGNLGTTVRRNQLMVTGNAGDTVVLTDLANWTATLPANVITINGNTYTGYNHNSLAAQLLIDTALTVSAT